MTVSDASYVSLTLAVLSLTGHMVAVGSPYWEYYRDELGASHSGLWTFCMVGIKCHHFTEKAMNGWFVTVQVLMSLCVPLHVATCLLLVFLVTTNKFFASLPKYRGRCTLASLLSCFTTAVLVTIGLGLYGFYQGKPASLLYWGYWTALTSLLINVSNFVCLSSVYCRQPKKDDERPILRIELPQYTTADSFSGHPQIHRETSRKRTYSTVSLVRDRHTSTSSFTEETPAPLSPSALTQIEMKRTRKTSISSIGV